MRSGIARSLEATGVLSVFLVALAAIVPPIAAASLFFIAPALPETDSGRFFFLRVLPALRFTVLQATLSALLAVLVGVPAAFLAARRNFPGRRLLLALSGVPLCVPPVVIALSFVLFYGQNGVLNTLLMTVFSLDEPPLRFLYSLGGVVLAHGLYNFPVVLRTVARTWERLPAEREQAATLLGAGPVRVFRTVMLPSLVGPILSSAVLVFLYCFFSFVIVLLFGRVGGTTLEVELYQSARNALNMKGSAFIVLVETGIASGTVFLFAWLQRFFMHTRGMTVLRPRRPLAGGRELLYGGLFLFTILIFFAGPLSMIIFRSLAVSPLGQYAEGLRPGFAGWRSLASSPSFFPALISTLFVGAAASILATVAALAYALYEERHGTNGPVMRALPLLPLAVSSVVLGFGWTLLVPRGSVAVLIVAQAAVSWPFAWTQIRTSLDRIPEEIPRAARLLSPRASDVSFRVLIPLARRGILSGAGFAFAISAGDATLPLVLSIPRFENLALLLFRLSGSYRFTEASACAVLLALITGSVFFLQDTDKEHSS